MWEATDVDQKELSMLAINSLEVVDVEVLKTVWKGLSLDRKAALKRKLMALAFL